MTAAVDHLSPREGADHARFQGSSKKQAVSAGRDELSCSVWIPLNRGSLIGWDGMGWHYSWVVPSTAP
jgi:hypothetical protein